MASLFGGLFGVHASAPQPSSGLFSRASRYRAQGSGAQQPEAELPASQGPPQHGARSRPEGRAEGRKRKAPAPAEAPGAVQPGADSHSREAQATRAAAAAAAAAAGAGEGEPAQRGKRRKKAKNAAREGSAAEGQPDHGPEGKHSFGKQHKARQQQPPPPLGVEGHGASDGGEAGPAAPAAAAAAAVPRPSGRRQLQAEQQQEAAAQAAAEAARLARTVFVGNLGATVRKKALQKLFSRYGSVESVRLRSLPVRADTKMPRRAAAVSGAVDTTRGSAHAYVVFGDAAAAEAALAHNMQEFEGLHLRVDRAARGSRGGRQSAEVQYDPARTLFVGNLHTELEDEELIRAFMDPSLSSELAGGVEAVRIVRDARTSAGKGVGFVLFRTRQACKAGLLLDGKVLRGRPLRVARLRRDTLQAAGKKGEKWRGAVTQGRGGKVAPPAAGAGKRGAKKGGPAVKKTVAGKRKAAGKRPAVAARKLRQRAAGGGKGKRG